MKKPLILDGSNAVKPNNTVVYAKNKVFDYLKSNFINESGFYEDVLNSPDIKYCGVIETPKKLVLFKLNGTDSEISTLTIENGVPIETLILSSLESIGLKFSLENPIQGEFTFNAENDLIISFVEGVGKSANPLRYLNIDNVGFDLTLSKKAVNTSDYNKLNANRDLKLPILTFVDVTETGTLPIGEYTLFVGYSDTYENDTNYIASLNPVTVYKQSATLDYFKVFDTDDLNAVSSKAITINATNLDTSYKTLVIGIVHQINGNKTGYKKYVNYGGSSTNITIDNLINLLVADVNEILVDNVIVDKVNAITQFDKELLIGNFTIQERIDIRSVAANIKVDYVLHNIKTSIEYGFGETIDIKDTYKSNINIVNNKLFQYDEVYALYIQPVFNSGELGEAVHIPGLATGGTLTIENGGNSAVVNNTAKLIVGTAEVFGIGIPDDETTADQIDVRIYTQYAELEKLNPNNVRLFQVKSITPNGNMAIWENEDEVYEVGHPYEGEKVRHHKIPDYANVHGVAAAATNEYQSDVIKLRLTNIDFADIDHPEYEVIQGYKILIAKRNQFDRTVVDEMTLYNTFTPNDETPMNTAFPISQLGRLSPSVITSEIYDVTGSASPYTATGSIGGVIDGDKTDVMGYAPRTMKNNDPLIANYLKITNVFQTKIKHHWHPIGDYDQMQDINNKYSIDCDLNEDFTDILYDASEDNSIKDLLASPEFLIQSSESIVGDGYSSNNIYLHYAEGLIYFKLYSELLIKSNAANAYQTCLLGASGQPLDYWATLNDVPRGRALYAKAQLRKYTANMYLTKEIQTLAKVSESLVVNTACNISGDSFLSGVAMRVSTRRINTVSILPYIDDMNFELRTPSDIEEDIQTIHTSTEDNYWLPNETVIDNLFGYRDDVDAEQLYASVRHKWLGRHPLTFEYWGVGERSIKSDWSLLGNGKVPIIYDIDSLFTNKFPYRAFRSLPMQTESITLRWRTFAPTSYHDIENTKGMIKTLSQVGNIIYIRQEFALVMYSVIPTMNVKDGTIALGTYGIFDNKSQDVISDSLGYIGSNSRFNSLVTPFGYFVVDVISKEVYKVIGNQATPLSLGVKGYFENKFVNDLQNPYLEGDYILGFNDVDKNVLITCNDVTTDKSFTMSYPVFNESFFSFHDYIPVMYARTTDNLFSLVNLNTNSYIRGGVYRHNDPSTRCIFYKNSLSNTRLRYEDIIDVLFNSNDANFVNKLLDHVVWITDSLLITDEGVKRLQDKTVDEIVVYSDTQCTETLTVNKEDVDWYDVGSGDNIQNTWSFNNILDSVDNPNDIIINRDFSINASNIIIKDYYDMSNFIGIFAVVRLIHQNNPVIIGENTEYIKQFINLVDVKFTKNER